MTDAAKDARKAITRVMPIGRLIRPEVETIIERAWERAASRPGVQLFDGPMCRMESFDASPERFACAINAVRSRCSASCASGGSAANALSTGP